MTICTKIFFTFLCITSIMLGGALICWRSSSTIDLYRSQTASAQHRLHALTELQNVTQAKLIDANRRFLLLQEDFRDAGAALNRDDQRIESAFQELETATQLDRLANLPSPPGEHETDLELRRKYEDERISVEDLVPLAARKDLKSLRARLLKISADSADRGLNDLTARSIEAERSRLDILHANLEAGISSLRRVLLLLALLASVAGLGLAYTLSRSISGRLVALQRATTEITNGNFDIRLSFRGHDEVTQLSYAFHDMAKSLNHAQSQVAKQQRFLVTASKMSALGEMASGIAHEIANPLAVIHMRAEQLNDMIASNEIEPLMLANCTRIIQENSLRITRIVKGLRSFSREGSQDPFQRSSVKTVLDDTLSFCAEKFHENNAALIIEAPIGGTELECQPSQISQVLVNLMNNALDAIESLPEKWVRISIEDFETSVEIRVTDSGKGIPTEIREKLMQPFFTTKPVGKGTGLGLSLSRKIIESHGGSFRIDPLAENTCFVITLPKFQQSSAAKAAA